MINVLGLWLILFAVLVGCGLLIVWVVRRLGGAAFGGALSLFQTMWLGYSALVCFLQVASFVLPISYVVIALSLAPAIAGYALHRREIARSARALRARPRTYAVVACIAVAMSVVIAYVASDRILLYDTGLYHLQTVKWMTHYSVVPGLANLHQRFGYNNSVHLFGAYTDAWWEGMAAHVANGFLLAAVLAQWFVEIFTARTPRGRLRQVFCLFTLPFLLAKLWTTIEVNSLSTDLPLAVLAFVLILELVSLPRVSPYRAFLPVTLVLALGAVAATTKLGGASLFAVACACVLVVTRAIAGRRARLVALALPVLLVVGWIVRGVMVSGWLAYPVFGRMPLSWAVPSDVAADDLGNIQSWSRMWGKPPSEVFGHGFWHWFSPWLDAFRTSHEFILLVVATALLAWRVAEGTRGTPTRHRAAEWLAVAACVLGIAQWFVGAPQLRYGSFLFWLLAAALVAPMLAPAMRDATTRMLVLIFVLAFTVWGDGFAFRQVPPPKLWGRLHAPQRVVTDRITTGPGTEISVPHTGDQCFDEELPCSAYTHQTARDPRELGAGYVP